MLSADWSIVDNCVTISSTLCTFGRPAAFTARGAAGAWAKHAHSLSRSWLVNLSRKIDR